MSDNRIIFKGQKIDYGNEIHIAAFIPDHTGQPKSYMANIGIWEIEENQPIEPLLRIDPQDAQQLADTLFSLGFTPTKIKNLDSPGELRATKYHLEDMRILVGINSRQSREEKN